MKLIDRLEAVADLAVEAAKKAMDRGDYHGMSLLLAEATRAIATSDSVRRLADGKE